MPAARLRTVGWIELVELPRPRQVGADTHRPDAVAPLVEPRREHPDPELPRQHRQHTAADAAFRWHAHVVDPAARRVVHPARRHHAEHVLHVLGPQRPLPGHRIHSLIGERGRHDREVAAVDEDRALPEVDVDRRARILGEHLVVSQQVTDGAIAMTGARLRLVHGRIDVQPPARMPAEHREHAGESLLRRRGDDLARGGDRPGIDHWIEGPPILRMEADGVEGVAAGLDAHLACHGHRAVVVQRKPVDEGLGDRLDREQMPGVADLVDVAVDRGHAEAELFRVGLGQFRNIGRDVALLALAMPLVQLVEETEHRRHGDGSGGGCERRPNAVYFAPGSACGEAAWP